MAEVVFREMQEEYLDAVRDIYLHYILNSTATFHARPLTREDMREFVFLKMKNIKPLLFFARKSFAGMCS